MNHAFLYHYAATVVRVIDGDTIVVDLDLGLGIVIRKKHVRLYGVDTWEMRGPEKEKGERAKFFVETRLPVGAQIIVRTERDKGGKYGRLLGTVLYEQGAGDWYNLNFELAGSVHVKAP